MLWDTLPYAADAHPVQRRHRDGDPCLRGRCLNLVPPSRLEHHIWTMLRSYVVKQTNKLAPMTINPMIYAIPLRPVIRLYYRGGTAVSVPPLASVCLLAVEVHTNTYI